MAIYDLFILQNGIRMRDKLSHGDFRLGNIHEKYEKACHLLVMLIIKLLYLFRKETTTETTTDIDIQSPLNEKDKKEKENNNENNNNENNDEIKIYKNKDKMLISSIDKFLHHYEIQFHPKSFILKNFKNLLLEMHTVYHFNHQLIIHNPTLFNNNSNNNSNNNDKILNPSTTPSSSASPSNNSSSERYNFQFSEMMMSL